MSETSKQWRTKDGYFIIDERGNMAASTDSLAMGALIVQAVNSLPLLQEAEKALEAIQTQLECPARNTNQGHRYGTATVISSDIREQVKFVLSRLRAARDQQPKRSRP